MTTVTRRVAFAGLDFNLTTGTCRQRDRRPPSRGAVEDASRARAPRPGGQEWKTSALPADEIDRILHLERVNDERGKRTYLAPVSELPAGVLVADGEGTPYLVFERRLMQWEPGGYTRSVSKPAQVLFRVLTPNSIVRTIARGYPVVVHPSAGRDSGRC
jgi:hypothetical protein